MESQHEETGDGTLYMFWKEKMESRGYKSADASGKLRGPAPNIRRLRRGSPTVLFDVLAQGLRKLFCFAFLRQLRIRA